MKDKGPLEYALALSSLKGLGNVGIRRLIAQEIDTSTHAGALADSGKTLAVLGTDGLNVSPAKNQQLAMDIQAHGCLLS